MFVLVSYDVSDDRRRSRVARVLEAFARRVQYSVFEGFLDERKFVELRGRLLAELDQTTDSVRFYRLCKRCAPSLEVLGVGPILEDLDVRIV